MKICGNHPTLPSQSDEVLKSKENNNVIEPEQTL